MLGHNAIAALAISATVAAAGGPAAYSLTCDPGSFSVTGVAATTVAGRMITASPGGFALTGVLALTARGMFVSAATGAYALAGVQASTLADRMVVASPGSFAHSGVAASTLADRVLSASPGSFSVGGVDATFVYVPVVGAFTLSADPGSFALSGAAVGALASRALDATPGSFAVAGIQASATAGRMASADPGAFGLSGVAASTVGGRALTVDPGTLTLSGVPVTTSTGRALIASPGACAISGVDAGLVYAPTAGAFTLTAEPGSFSIDDGGPASTLAGRILLAAPGALQLRQPINDVDWTNVVGCHVDGNGDLVKDAPGGWGSGGAISSRVLTGDGYAERTVQADFAPGVGYLMFGLSRGDDSQSYDDIDFAIYSYPSDPGIWIIYEGGNYVTQGGADSCNAGDVHRVAVEGGAVKYYVNGVLVHTSALSPSFPLVVDTALLDIGARVEDAKIIGETTLTAERVISSAVGLYSHAGSPITCSTTRVLVAVEGAFAITGTNATLLGGALSPGRALDLLASSRTFTQSASTRTFDLLAATRVFDLAAAAPGFPSLLLEDGGFILFEDGGGILQESRDPLEVGQIVNAGASARIITLSASRIEET
jgi:hypothetical protein